MNRQMRAELAYADLALGVHLKVQAIGTMNVRPSSGSDSYISRMSTHGAIAVRTLSRVHRIRKSDARTFVRNDGPRSG
jgi:hypothetical protein